MRCVLYERRTLHEKITITYFGTYIFSQPCGLGGNGGSTEPSPTIEPDVRIEDITEDYMVNLMGASYSNINVLEFHGFCQCAMAFAPLRTRFLRTLSEQQNFYWHVEF